LEIADAFGQTGTRLGGGGEGYLASLQSAAGKGEGKITFTGPIFDPGELASCFVRRDFFIYPSLSERGESFGLAAGLKRWRMVLRRVGFKPLIASKILFATAKLAYF